MKKRYRDFIYEMAGGDTWYPIRKETELEVNDYVRTPDGLVKVVKVNDMFGSFYGEIITPIHKDVVKGETYEYKMGETQVLAKKKNRSKVSMDDLMGIDDKDGIHKSNEVDLSPVMEKEFRPGVPVGACHDPYQDWPTWSKSLVRKNDCVDGSISSSTRPSGAPPTLGLGSDYDSREEKREALQVEGITSSIARGVALRLKSKAIKAGRSVRGMEGVDNKIDMLSKQVSAVAGLALLAVSVSGEGLLSKAGILSGIFTEGKEDRNISVA